LNFFSIGMVSGATDLLRPLFKTGFCKRENHQHKQKEYE